MQALQPLGIVDITLASGNGAYFASVRYNRFDPPVLKYLEDRHPVHTGRFHRYRLDTHRHEPIGQALNLTGEGTKGPYRFPAQRPWNRNHVEARSNVDSRRTFMDDREPRWLPASSDPIVLLQVEHAGRGNRIRSPS